MNRGIYATASGMIGAQELLDVITHNLANSSTSGFKKEGIAFDDAFSKALRANGGAGPMIGSLGSGPQELSRYTDLSAGSIAETGNPLDIAITSATGFFAIQTPGGDTLYTRNGSFMIDESGNLTTKSGNPVLDDRGQAIRLSSGEVKITETGAVMVDGVEEASLGVFEGTFTKRTNTEFTCADAKAIDTPTLRPNAIEGSNVNPIETMVGMITLNRSFELAQRSIIQQDDLTQRLIQSLADR